MSPRKKTHSQHSQMSIWCHWTGLLWISHLSARYIPRQGSYTCNQASATTQHNHRSKKLSGISKYCGPFCSKSSYCGRAYTKNHTRELSMVVGPGVVWSLQQPTWPHIQQHCSGWFSPLPPHTSKSWCLQDWNQWHLESEAPWWLCMACCVCKP